MVPQTNTNFSEVVDDFSALKFFNQVCDFVRANPLQSTPRRTLSRTVAFSSTDDFWYTKTRGFKVGSPNPVNVTLWIVERSFKFYDEGYVEAAVLGRIHGGFPELRILQIRNLGDLTEHTGHLFSHQSVELFLMRR